MDLYGYYQVSDCDQSSLPSLTLTVNGTDYTLTVRQI